MWLLDDTHTAMGARLMHSLVLNPLHSKQEIEYRLMGVEELYNATLISIGLADTLK